MKPSAALFSSVPCWLKRQDTSLRCLTYHFGSASLKLGFCGHFPYKAARTAGWTVAPAALRKNMRGVLCAGDCFLCAGGCFLCAGDGMTSSSSHQEETTD